MADASLPPDLVERLRSLERQVQDLQRSQNPTAPNLFDLNDVSGQAARSGQVMEYDRDTGRWTPGEILSPGDIKWTASTVALAGRWLYADGAAVSRTTYADLFAAIGTTYGAGNGTTTFNVPDLDSRMVIGAGTDALGATGGSRNAIVVTHGHGGFDHNHGINANVSSVEASGYGLDPSASFADRVLIHGTSTDISTGTDGAAYNTGSSGSSGTNANLPPFIALYGYIRY